MNPTPLKTHATACGHTGIASGDDAGERSAYREGGRHDQALTGAWQKATGALRAGWNRLEPTPPGRVWKQLSQLGIIDNSLQFATVFTLGFIPFLMVLSAAFGSRLAHPIVIQSVFSAKAAYDVSMLFAHGRPVPASLSVLGVIVAVLGGAAISHMIQTWYAKIFRVEIRRWKAMAHRTKWLAGVFGYVALQVVIANRVQPFSGHIAVGGLRFLLAVAFWWWSLHCLLAGQIPWWRLFPAGLATAICCAGLGLYITWVASISIVANEASYGPIGAVFTLVTVEIGLAVALQLGAAIGATIGASHPARRRL